MTRRFLATALLCLGIAGCEAKPKPTTEVDVSGPGVNVQTGADGSTTITAPGVNVQAGPGGTTVSAPGVDVKAGK